MASITIVRKHALPHRRARLVAERIARELQQRFALEYAWHEDRVEFRRAGVSGTMQVERDCIALDVHLGRMLTLLKPRIERAIQAQLDELIDGDRA